MRYVVFSVLLGWVMLTPCFSDAQGREEMLTTINKNSKNGSTITFIEERLLGSKLKIEKYRLSNGLTILLLEDHSAPVFAYQTWFNVGSRHEKKGRTGLAHLFEHLMFKATKNMKDGEFDKIMEENGAETNAATWVDWTYYRENLPTGKLELTVKLEADRMENMILNEAQLESERDVVKNERRYRVDNDPEGKMYETLYDTAFDVSPYKWPTIGWMEDISAITLQDCLDFYQTYYSPNNATIVVVGDFATSEALTLLNNYYGHMARAEIPKENFTKEPPQKKEKVKELSLPVATAKLLIGFHSPALMDKDHAAVEVLNKILFSGESSRLYIKLVLENEIASNVDGWVGGYTYPGLYEIYVGINKDAKPEQAESLLFAELEKMVKEGPTEKELVKAKNKIETELLRFLQSVGAKARAFGSYETVSGDFKNLFVDMDSMRQVTVKDVQRVAGNIFTLNNRTIIRVLPKE